MKWLALLALAGAQALRGPDGLQVVHEVHRRPHISLLTQKRRHTELTRETVHGVDFSSLSQGEVNQGEMPSQILAGAGSFPDEAQVAAAPSAAPLPSLVARSQHKHVQEPAAPADAASFVFGGSPPQQEALTRDEVQAMHAAAPKLPVAAQRAAKPYSVTIDVPHPQMSALHAASQVTQAQAAQQQAALQQQQEQQAALQQQQVQAAMQQVQQQQQFLRRTSQQQTALAATAQNAAIAQNAAVAQTPSGITRPKGWDQCLKFSRFIKSQGVTGMELIKTWKSSCEPAVQSGVATERYKVMCNALGGAVEPFASQQDYDVTKMCDAVLAVFHDVTAVDVRAATDA